MWREYHGSVADWLPDGPRALLGHLANGRPLKAQGLNHDGCMFGWLTAPEVSQLLTSLRGLAQSHPVVESEEFVYNFHADLLKSLAACEGRCLLIGA